jgi:ubiquinone/menaquinone biosynthesis C-methylase UbiE
MPDLDTDLHLNMLAGYRKGGVVRRLLRAIKRELQTPTIYGLEWGDPETNPPLKYLRDKYVRAYVNPEHVCAEIGPGGGRWTRYMLNFKKLYLIDYHEEMFGQLRRHFDQPNMEFIKNNGTDFPGVPDASVDFLLSMGVFVHLEKHLIEGYLQNMKRILKPGANVVIQYSDKNKPLAQRNPAFSQNTAEDMRKMVTDAGYRIVEEDTATLWHSNIIRFTP